MTKRLKTLQIFVINRSSPRGILRLGLRDYPCLLGRNGLASRKREGDGKSPVGRWRIQDLWIKAGQKRIRTGISRVRQITPGDGWCDAPDHPCYNRPIKLPFGFSHEVLLRQDTAYDVMVVLDYNMTLRKRGAGSAIFLHVADPAASFTQGCVALRKADLFKILQDCTGHTSVQFGPTHAPRRLHFRP